MKERVILHIDANNFYASVECAVNPELKNKPVAVTGDPKTRTGIVVAKNQIAKEMDVKTGDIIWQAKQKCPDLVCVKQNRDLYLEYSDLLFQIYKRYTDFIEPFGIDECWLDITSTLNILGGDPVKIAAEIRKAVKDELKITVSVGISFCKIFAKLGSDLKKPDATTVITRENFKETVYPLDVTAVIGIGKKIEKVLHLYGIKTIGQLVQQDSAWLQRQFNKTMAELKEKLLGNDRDPVDNMFSPKKVKSIGNGTTAIIDIQTKKDIFAVVDFLCDEISTRLRAKHLLTSLIHVTFKSAEFEYFGKQHKLKYHTQSSHDITKECKNLIEKFWGFNKRVRMLRISCGALKHENDPAQLSFFDNPSNSTLDKTVDRLRNKYGYNIIKQGSVMGAKHINPDAVRLDSKKPVLPTDTDTAPHAQRHTK